MGCLIVILIVFGPRIAIFVWWLLNQPLFILAFQNWSLPGFLLPVWAWPLLGVVFLPWTTLAYLALFPNGIVGYEWIVIGIALLIDLAGYGGGYQHRDRFSNFQGNRSID